MVQQIAKLKLRVMLMPTNDSLKIVCDTCIHLGRNEKGHSLCLKGYIWLAGLRSECDDYIDKTKENKCYFCRKKYDSKDKGFNIISVFTKEVVGYLCQSCHKEAIPG